MARHYNSKDFFRQIPNALLERYFHSCGLFLSLDFSSMKETKPDKLFNAWLQLEDTVRNEMETVFREIYEMSCRKGFQAIIDEANQKLLDMPEVRTKLIEDLSKLPNHYHRAMVTFLDHFNLWKGATRFYQADTLSSRDWCKRKNLGNNCAAIDLPSLEELASSIGGYFHYAEGRGRSCLVEYYRRGKLDYYFAYPEDHSQQSIEWVEGEFFNRPHNPAFVILFVYSQTEGSLDINFHGSNIAFEHLQRMFAISILKQEDLQTDPRDRRVYDLDPLLEKNFDFVFDVISGIERVAVKKLRLSSRSTKGVRITLEADITSNSKAVYDQLEVLKKSIPLHLYNVTQVELSALIRTDPNKSAKIKPIRITHPNFCSLKYDEHDLKLRAMLIASGIETKELEGLRDETRKILDRVD
ncbi:TPA: hypothetical protein JD771_002483 [Legionella pneumophila subsp. pneumophila]|nr:hypothetical protein [Legionella pneumophila subsp. pneumophila]